MDTTEVLCTCPACSLQVGVDGGEGSTADHWGQSKKDIGDTSGTPLPHTLQQTHTCSIFCLFVYLFIYLAVGCR